MIDFKRILFPVDFSAQSRATAPSVQAMARHFEAEITLLHVGAGPDDLAKLEEFAARELSGARVVRELAEGDPAQQIIKYALGHGTLNHAMDLIMMPTHGHGPFRELLLGSVTATVLREARCPVWTGVHAETLTAHSPEHWKRMLCALDTHGKDVKVIQWASAFASQQRMELQLVHAVAGTDAMWTEQNDPSMYEFLFDAARERLVELQAAAGTSLEIRLVGGSVASAVRKAAMEDAADLIVMGRDGTAIVREAPCPVISV